MQEAVMLKSYSLIDNKFQHVITLMFYYSHCRCCIIFWYTILNLGSKYYNFSWAFKILYDICIRGTCRYLHKTHRWDNVASLSCNSDKNHKAASLQLNHWYYKVRHAHLVSNHISVYEGQISWTFLMRNDIKKSWYMCVPCFFNLYQVPNWIFNICYMYTKQLQESAFS